MGYRAATFVMKSTLPRDLKHLTTAIALFVTDPPKRGRTPKREPFILWASQKTLTRATGWSLSSIRRGLLELEGGVPMKGDTPLRKRQVVSPDHPILEVVSRGGGRRGNAGIRSRYRFHVENLPFDDEQINARAYVFTSERVTNPTCSPVGSYPSSYMFTSEQAIKRESNTKESFEEQAMSLKESRRARPTTLAGPSPDPFEQVFPSSLSEEES
jgi:hypothetical protein